MAFAIVVWGDKMGSLIEEAIATFSKKGELTPCRVRIVEDGENRTLSISKVSERSIYVVKSKPGIHQHKAAIFKCQAIDDERLLNFKLEYNSYDNKWLLKT